MHILHEEFNLDTYVKEGIVIDHFPLNNFVERENVLNEWEKNKIAAYIDQITLTTNRLAIKPLNAISTYYGPEVGFYITFILLMTGSTIIIAVPGLAMEIYAWYVES